MDHSTVILGPFSVICGEDEIFVQAASRYRLGVAKKPLRSEMKLMYNEMDPYTKDT